MAAKADDSTATTVQQQDNNVPDTERERGTEWERGSEATEPHTGTDKKEERETKGRKRFAISQISENRGHMAKVIDSAIKKHTWATGQITVAMVTI